MAMTVLYHVRGFHPAKRFKHFTQIVPGNIVRQIPYADLHSVPLSLDVEHLCFAGVLNQKK